MIFNSVDFAVFLPVVFAIYWLLGSRRRSLQNVFILVASYTFYGWWDYRFLVLLVISSTADYIIGLDLGRTRGAGRRRLLLIGSLVVNLGLLGFFKYYGFFVENFARAFTLFGRDLGGTGLSIVLPIGISFYTFQTLSYTIDVYRGRIPPTRDVVAFFAFVSFFPQLVAGPIERAANLLPQFQRPRHFDLEGAKDGARQMLWGLFKKVVIADTCALRVNEIFADPELFSSPNLVLGAVYFALQIYGDFSGYSDIAIGCSRLFGFRLRRNFAYPYFARDIAEFWRRWHISLSTWFRDYVYIPLGGSRDTLAKTVRNAFIVFVVSGFWHGANWTFLAWGALHALYFIPLVLRGKTRANTGVTSGGRWWPSPKEMAGIAMTFCLTTFAWIFFRAESMTQAFAYIGRIFAFEALSFSEVDLDHVPLILGLLAVEWVQRTREHALDIRGLPLILRWVLYFIVAWLILFHFGESQEFIYFQF